MMNTKILRLRSQQLRQYWSVIKDKSLKKEFFDELALLNFNRQKYFGYFLLLMGAFQLFSDLVWTNFWETHQIDSFMILDITVVVAASTVILISHIKPPKKPGEIKSWHKVYFYVYLAYHLLWSTFISIIESENTNSVPTYMIGIFAAATIYLHRGVPFLLYLLASLFILFTGLYLNNMDPGDIITQYSSATILVVICWVLSRILMNTRKLSFLSRKEIESARDNLDGVVKERTLKLQTINTQLLEEIKERQKYEKSLKQEKKKAEEADRLKSVFLANMSHEIRTPLNGIIGFGDLLGSSGLSDEKKNRYLEIIRNNSQQLLKLIDDLMDISMIESNQLRLNKVKFQISHLLPDAEVFYKDYARYHNKENVVIINDGLQGSSDDTLESDPARVQQVLYNLLSNAVKFTHQGHIRFGGKVEDGYVLIYVEDTGIGIKKNSCEAIFQRFRQGEESTTRSYGGTGLGLSISEGIIQLLGGMIWIDMSYDQGSRFCFSLPTSSVNTPLNRKKFLPALKFLGKHAILISDGNADKPHFLDHPALCGKVEFKRFAASNFHKARSDAGSILLIDLTDTPESDYHKVLGPILQNNQAMVVPNIHPDPDKKKSLMNMGCSQVLETPVNINLLLGRIHSIMAQ